MENKNLEACPYCGNRSLEVRENGHREKYVYCPECGAQGGCEEGYEEDYVSHIEKWNRRSKFNPDTDVALEPCPFCGNEHAEIIPCGNNFHIFCPSCLVTTSDESTREKAIDVWNKRVNDLKSDLKPCPICGGKVELVLVNSSDAHNEAHIECTKCHCFLMRWCGETSESLKEYWNSYEVPIKRAPAIRSCPICGTAAVYWCRDGKHYVACDNTDCNFQTPAMDSQQEAADIWNGGRYV